MLLSKAVAPPSNAVEERTLSWPEMQQWLQQVFFSGEELAHGRGSAERESPVAAAHRILTNSFGVIPFSVYRKDGDARRPVSDPDLDLVLKVRPTPAMSPFLCRKVQMSNAFWHGIGCIWNRRDKLGRLVGRLPLPSDCLTIRKDKESGLYWYDYNVDGQLKTFSAYEISFLFFETYDGIYGRGLLDLARESIATDGMAQRYAKKFYQNGARLSGVLEVDTDATADTRQKLKGEFRNYASDEAFAVAVLDHGMKFTPLGLSQSDAQFIESRQFGVEEIARFTGIPKYMLQVGKEAYNSNAQQRIDYVTDTLMPFVTQTEQEDTYKVLNSVQRDDNWYIRGNVEVLLRADPITRATFYEKMVQNSVYCPDDCRAKEEKDPIPGGLGKRFLATKNLGSLESILEGEK